ncbi:hypothetical protein AMECASPLE_034310 [Ameca splendens]|uniref:Uncharacterized protein n=1 Tax=Ameca splendens TaxID=208324 RepID=A0ABV0YU28_9TELE
MFRIVVLLEGEPSPKSQVLQPPQQVFFLDCNEFSSIQLQVSSEQLLCCWSRKASLQHDAATTVFDCEDGMFRVMYSVTFLPHMAFCLLVKKLHFILTCCSLATDVFLELSEAFTEQLDLYGNLITTSEL